MGISCLTSDFLNYLVPDIRQHCQPMSAESTSLPFNKNVGTWCKKISRFHTKPRQSTLNNNAQETSCYASSTRLSTFCLLIGWFSSRVFSVLDSGAEGPGFKSQSRHCQVTVLGKLFTPIVPLFTKQQNR